MVVRSHEGREPVAPARVERIGACGRGEQATHSGGVGAPPGGQYGLPARSWLTAAVPHLGRPPQSAPDRRRKTPDGAPEGATPSKEGVHIRTDAPAGAPSPLFFGREANIPKLGRICAARTTIAIQ